MRKKTVKELHQKVRERFMKEGLCEEDATELTEHFMYSELRGIKSHGLVRIKWILDQLHKYPEREIKQILVNGPCELYDAANVLGYLALKQVVDMQGNAEKQTIKVLGVQNTYPTGTLSYFAEKLSQKGWIVLLTSTSPRRVGLYGDDHPLVGTNPWTFSLPNKTSLGGNVVVDTSLAEVTHGQC
jgi:ureidoglycolate dehydrogenase (NAD+)